MKTLVALGMVWLAVSAAAQEVTVESLIDRLKDVSEEDLGYSSSISGTGFILQPDSLEIGTMLLGQKAPQPSSVMIDLVRKGADAIPALLQHLEDRTPTKIPPVAGLMWTSQSDYYDFNKRTTPNGPHGVNLLGFEGGDALEDYQITVGDLCFVALGQIVNRSFQVCRYQPSGGIMVSSPCLNPALAAAARLEFGKLNQEKHLARLKGDFLDPDGPHRSKGAIVRIAYYFPEAKDELLLQQPRLP